MNDPMHDLETGELRVHRLLTAIPPQPLPLGFRDGVMRRVAGERKLTWEWFVAMVLALPSAAFLMRESVVHADDFTAAINNVALVASGQTGEVFFFVDGLMVLSVTLLGVASLIAAHALLSPSERTRLSR